MRALFTAATGLSAQQTRIDNIANNLANVSTTGFKKGREVFEDLIYQEMAVGDTSGEVGRPNTLQVGSGTRMVAITRDQSTGNIQHTGNPLDLALGGQGFFMVETVDGSQLYTRDGKFHLNADGELVTSAGHLVSPGVQIPQDAQDVTVAADGTISAVFGDSPTDLVTLGTLEVVEFANPSGLKAQGGNLFAATPESGEALMMDAQDGRLNVQQGFLEASNVDVAEELVAMILAQRAFELTSKVMEAADETLRTVANLKR